jgi:hypothetical protein
MNNYKIKTIHIPGVNNNEADALSRLSRSGDYSIKNQLLHNQLKEWHIEVTVDAFANRKNRKTKRFFSINKDVWAEARDGLNQNWAKEIALIHPPIPILGRALNKIAEEEAISVVICPIWKG